MRGRRLILVMAMVAGGIVTWSAVKGGHAPIGEKLDRELQQTLAQQPDAIERQLIILEWFYARFRRYLSDSSIIKYEDLIASGADVYQFTPAQPSLEELFLNIMGEDRGL